MTNKPNENSHWKKLPVLTEVIDKTPARIPILTQEASNKTSRLPVLSETLAPSDPLTQEALVSLTAEQCAHFNTELAAKIAALFHYRFADHAEWAEFQNALPEIIRTQLIESSTGGLGIIPPSFNKPILNSTN